MMKKLKPIILLFLAITLGITSIAAYKIYDYKTKLEVANSQPLLDVNRNLQKLVLNVSTNEMIITYMDDIVNSWYAQETSKEEVLDYLRLCVNIKDEYVAEKARQYIDTVTVESLGNAHLKNAEEYYKNGEYFKVLRIAIRVSDQYSQYQAFQTIYDDSKEAIKYLCSNIENDEEYQYYLNELLAFNKIHTDDDLTKVRNDLSKEYNIYIDIRDNLNESMTHFDHERYQEAFDILGSLFIKYPKDERVLEAAKYYQDLYTVIVTRKVGELITSEKYDKAYKYIKDARKINDCNGFDKLEDLVKKEKNFLYRIFNNTKDSIEGLFSSWDKEQFDVVKASEGTANYIVKSGKKIMLGDYTDEDITLLSFGGNIIAGLANLDLMFDLRDLSYDITHWGEEEYFLLYLTADAVALVPVLGAVKYLDCFKNGDDVLKPLKDFIGNIASLGKKTNKITDVVGEIIDASKHTDDFTEVIDNVGDFMKTSAKNADEVKDVVKHYEVIVTRNSKYAGQCIPNTNVMMVTRKIELKDGRRIQGGFPVFDSKIDVKLPEHLWKSTRKNHNKYLNKYLKELFESDPTNDVFKSFSKETLQELKEGKALKNFVWHHNEEEGLMQLVDKKAHYDAQHTGGMSIWGQED